MDRLRSSSLKGEDISLTWLAGCDDVTLEPYFWLKKELSVSDNCLMHGCRVVVPEQSRRLVLNELHLGHPGISRMRGLGRILVWWPGFGKDVDMFVKNCPECKLHEKTLPHAPLHHGSGHHNLGLELGLRK